MEDKKTNISLQEEKINSSPYLNEEDLKNIKNFRYNCKNDSILYNYVTSPLLEKYFVCYLPMWIAPNILTLLSFIFNFVTYLVIQFEAGNNFNLPISRFACLLQFFTHMIYIILDNSDGKQARRTNSSSPLGLLFDHGFDVLTTCIVAYNISHMIMIGNSDLKSPLLYVALYTGFWANVYEEYIVKFMHLGMINGPDEGNFILAMGALLTGIFGVDIWDIKIYHDFTISDFMITFLCLGTLQTIYQCINSILIHKKSIKPIVNFVIDSLNFLLSISIIYSTFFFDFKTFVNYTSYVYILVSLNFSRITIEMEVNIIADKKYYVNYMVLITNLIWLIVVLYVDKIRMYVDVRYILQVLIFVNFSSFVNYVLNVLNQIKSHLGINIFTIQPYSSVNY
jgi:ethanolaminephosphotransferase